MYFEIVTSLESFLLQRKSKAKEIYDKHVSVRACECVNIDSVARKAVESQLENPTPQAFDIPQQQVSVLTVNLAV